MTSKVEFIDSTFPYTCSLQRRRVDFVTQHCSYRVSVTQSHTDMGSSLETTWCGLHYSLRLPQASKGITFHLGGLL